MPPDAPAATTQTPAASATSAEPISVQEAIKRALEETGVEADTPTARLLDTPAEKPAKESAESRDRGKDGKFKPKDEKPETEAAPKAKDKPAEPAGENRGGLGYAKKLIGDGNIEKALELIGLSPEKLTAAQWGAFRDHAKKAKATAHQALAAAEAKENEVKAEARKLYEELSPLVSAKRALDAGQYEEAIKLLTGDDMNTFNKKVFHKFANDPPKDPEVAALRRELAEIKAQKQQEKQQEASQAQQVTAEQAKARYMRGLVDEVASTGAEKFGKAMKVAAFREAVFQIQQDHWDPHTKSTLPAAEAAELAWEELYDPVLGGDDQPTVSRDRGTTTREKTDRSSTSARQSAKAGTYLKQAEAAEASEPPNMGPDEILAYYIRKAQAEARAT